MNKALFTLVFFSLLAFTASAQAPQAFKYQAVVRDANGQILANQAVTLGTDLLQNGLVVYSEDHNATTNAFGLVNLEIGRGDVVLAGDFTQIDWSVSTFISLLLDPTGGNNLQNIGASELLSVPYALYAANATGGSGLPADAQRGDLLYHDGTAWQRLPAGAAGTVLTMGADGLPTWEASSLLKVTMANGDVIYVSPVDNNDPVLWGPHIDITALTNITTVAASDMDFNGEANTAAIVAQVGNNSGTAYPAKICDDLTAYGFDDWYLPAAGELKQMFYTLGAGGINEIPSGYFWSSTEYSYDRAWVQGFDLVLPDAALKGGPYLRCRCVRK